VGPASKHGRRQRHLQAGEELASHSVSENQQLLRSNVVRGKCKLISYKGLLLLPM